MPPKVAKVEMDEEELKLKQKIMEQMELKKLIREDRLIKNASAKDEATERQEKVVTALTKEKDELLNNLNVMQSQKQCAMDAKKSSEINELFAKGDSLDVDIAVEQKLIADLKYQIHKESNELERRRRNVKSDFSASEYRQQREIHRADRALESGKKKLHAEQVKLSSEMNENSDLRKRIIELLKSKSHFNDLFEELILKLDKGKKIMKDIVDQSQAQLKTRDEVARKIQALKQRDEADMKKRQEEMQDLEIRFEDENILSQFRHAAMYVRTKLSEGDKATKKADAQRLLQEQELQELRDTWKAVQEMTGLEECKDVCDLLTKQEAENFSLFNYNNELHDQLEVLTEQVAELLRKVEDEQDKAIEFENTEERECQVLEIKLEKMEHETYDRNDMCEASRRLFDRVLTKLKLLLETAECETWPLEDLLGENDEVTQFNYRLFLELLESRLMKLISVCPLVDMPQMCNLGTSFTDIMTQPQNRASKIVNKKDITLNCIECEATTQTKRVIQVIDYERVP